MTYATVEDIQARMTRTLTEDEQRVCNTLLEDAAAIIDAFAINAEIDLKKTVSCRMVARAIGNDNIDVPVGATQGSMGGLGYTQSWTMSGGSVGELYLSKLDKQLLRRGNLIGSYSPAESLVPEVAS